MSPLVCSTSRQSIRVSGGVCHFPFQHPRPRYGCLKILVSSHTHSMHVIQYKNTQNFRIQHSELHLLWLRPTASFPGQPGQAGTRKVKPVHMQTICTWLQADNHTNISSLNFYRPDALPDAQPTVSKQEQNCYKSN